MVTTYWWTIICFHIAFNAFLLLKLKSLTPKMWKMIYYMAVNAMVWTCRWCDIANRLLQLILSVCEKELHRPDTMINVKKVTLRIGLRHNAKCSNIIASDSNIIMWSNTIGYLGVNIVAHQKFACSLDDCRGLSIEHLMLFLARWVGSPQKTS